MKVIVMRHGEAEPYQSSDRERVLTDYGRQQAQAAGRWLKEQGLLIQQCWVSPYVRTQQTAEQVGSTYGDFGLTTANFLTPDSSPQSVMEQLQNANGSNLLLISHNPLVSQLVNYLNAGQHYGAASMGTASLALFEGEPSGDQWLAGCCELKWLRHAPHFERAL